MKEIPALKVEQWPTEKLVDYARNPRKNDEQVQRMVAALHEFGFRIPIVAKSDGSVVDGHLRLKAARQLGLETVPVALADELTDAQVKAFRLLANKSASWAEWDTEFLKLELAELQEVSFDLDLTGFSTVELDNVLGSPVLDPAGEWEGMPEFQQDDKTAFRSLTVHFPDQEAVEAFEAAIGQQIAQKAKFIWYPEAVIERYADKLYAA